jgi:hypothetical protein
MSVWGATADVDFGQFTYPEELRVALKMHVYDTTVLVVLVNSSPLVQSLFFFH